MDVVNVVAVGLAAIAVVGTTISAIRAQKIANNAIECAKAAQINLEKRAKKQATLEAYDKLLVEACSKINEYDIKTIKDAYAGRHLEMTLKIDSYINKVENFCVGLEQDVYDYDIFYELAHGRFDDGMFRDRLEAILSSKDNAEVNYENLYKVWERLLVLTRENNILRVYKVSINPEDKIDPREEASLAKEQGK